MITDSLERIEGFREKWPFVARYLRVNGWRMHYVDEGIGDPILLLHGNPTWGFLYRDVIPPLVEAGHRVIVPDMVGFGLSEKPAREGAHSLDGHIANLTGLVRQLDLHRLTVVCHDWGGPTGLGLAMSNPECVRALAVMSTWAWPTPPAEFHTPGLRSPQPASPATRPIRPLHPVRSCSSRTLLIRYRYSRPLCGSCLVTSYDPPGAVQPIQYVAQFLGLDTDDPVADRLAIAPVWLIAPPWRRLNDHLTDGISTRSPARASGWVRSRRRTRPPP
jgi:pimeloyl-ACP methyl ester carboxylesterase